jgi:hypothetical protein
MDWFNPFLSLDYRDLFYADRELRLIVLPATMLTVEIVLGAGAIEPSGAYQNEGFGIIDPDDHFFTASAKAVRLFVGSEGQHCFLLDSGCLML